MIDHNTENSNNKIISRGLYSLWFSFSLSVAIYLTPIILSNYVGVFYFPIIALVLSGLTYLFLKSRRQSTHGEVDCMLPLYVMARVMLTYGIIMLIVNLCVLRLSDLKVDLMEIDKSFHFYYYPVLILSILSAAYGYFAIRNVCVYCLNCNGFSAENSIYSNLQRSEISNTMRQLMIISCIMGVSGWIYFFVLYNSANVSKFDRLVFSGVPVIVILLHEISISIRYLSILYYSSDIYSRTPFKKGKSILRYIVIHDDSVLLKEKDNSYDTPYTIVIDYAPNMTLERGKELFVEKFKFVPQLTKLIFTNIDKYNSSCINHFLCFFNINITKIDEQSRWISTQEFEQLNKEGKLSPLLKSEAYRVFTTLMSYKQYDLSGKCRYRIKGYRPSVSISDIQKYDLDYNDKRWLMILALNSKNNSILSRVRLFFYKYIEGIID